MFFFLSTSPTPSSLHRWTPGGHAAQFEQQQQQFLLRHLLHASQHCLVLPATLVHQRSADRDNACCAVATVIEVAATTTATATRCDCCPTATPPRTACKLCQQSAATTTARAKREMKEWSGAQDKGCHYILRSSMRFSRWTRHRSSLIRRNIVNGIEANRGEHWIRT